MYLDARELDQELVGKTIAKIDVDGFEVLIVFTDGTKFTYSASDGGCSRWDISVIVKEEQKQMNNWRDDKVTDKQLEYILEMREHSEYPLPEFTGTTKGEAADYINKWTKLAHESRWMMERGY